MFKSKALIALILIGSFPVFAPAAVVVLNSTKTDANGFEIRASVSGGDSGGIASYSIQFENRPDIYRSSLQNYSPRIWFLDYSRDGMIYQAAFTIFRNMSGDNASVTFTGSQDTIGGNAICVNNFGLTRGNLEDLNTGGWTVATSSKCQTVYPAEVVLVKGRTASGAPAPRLINDGAIMVPGQLYTVGNGTFFNVFVSSSGRSTMSAPVAVATPTPTPDPTVPTPTPDPNATPTPTEEELPPDPDATPTPTIGPEATPIPTPFPLIPGTEVTPTPEPEATPTPEPGVDPSPNPDVTPTPTPTDGDLSFPPRWWCFGLGAVIPLSMLGALLFLGGTKFQH